MASSHDFEASGRLANRSGDLPVLSGVQDLSNQCLDFRKICKVFWRGENNLPANALKKGRAVEPAPWLIGTINYRMTSGE
jgi:hypothetical protein